MKVAYEPQVEIAFLICQDGRSELTARMALSISQIREGQPLGDKLMFKSNIQIF